MSSCPQRAATAARRSTLDNRAVRPDARSDLVPVAGEATVDLLRRARDGDQGAWEQVFARHRRALKRIAHRRLPVHARGMTDTEDLVQDAFTRELRYVHDRDFSARGALLAYLRRAVINRILDEARRSARVPPPAALPIDVPTSTASPLDVVIGREKAAIYRRAMARLKTRDRRLILLRFEMGLSNHDVSARLGMRTADAARVAAGRALWRLAQLFSEEQRGGAHGDGAR